MKFDYIQDCITPEVYAAAVKAVSQHLLGYFIDKYETNDTAVYAKLTAGLRVKLPKFVSLGEYIKILKREINFYKSCSNFLECPDIPNIYLFYS